MEHKKNKIQDIALRNKLKSIFTDNDEYQNIFDKVLHYGIPEFIYRDFHQKRKLESRDLYFYFQPGSDVKFINNDQELTGKIKHYDLNNKTIEITYLNEVLTINIINVCRII
jgi:beta-xylosidase